MPSYDYRDHVQSAFRDRFPNRPDIIGADDWEQSPGDTMDLARPPLPPLAMARLFVSHSQKDTALAERVAWLADQNGFEFWLDVFDPSLLALSPGHPSYSRAVASLIEMALVNCTHLIALYTNHACDSRWVSYEYGRAKDRLRTAQSSIQPPIRPLLSTSVGAWLPRATPHRPAVQPEYLLLGKRPYTEADIISWLVQELAKTGRPPGPLGYWPLHMGPPAALPP